MSSLVDLNISSPSLFQPSTALVSILCEMLVQREQLRLAATSTKWANLFGVHALRSVSSSTVVSCSFTSPPAPSFDATIAVSVLDRQVTRALHVLSSDQLTTAAESNSNENSTVAQRWIARTFPYWQSTFTNLQVIAGTHGPILTTAKLSPTSVATSTLHTCTPESPHPLAHLKWSIRDKRGFLHACERIGLLSQILVSERVLMKATLRSWSALVPGIDQGEPDYRPLYRPVPFILRWTESESKLNLTAAAAQPTNPSNAEAVDAASSSDSIVRVNHPISVRQLLDGSWRSSSSDANFPWLLTGGHVLSPPVHSSSLTQLSSIVKGCPWYLQCSSQLDTSEDECLQFIPFERMSAEQLVIANRLAEQLGLNPTIREDINGIRVRDGHMGNYRDCPSDDLHIGPSSCRHPWRHFFSRHSSRELDHSIDTAVGPYPSNELDGPRSPISTQCNTAFQRVFTSSLWIALGRNSLRPWPLFLVGPLAPGWVGGFILAENIRD